MDETLRRRNLRTAWLLAAFVAFLFFSSVPFWRGVARLVSAAGGA